ncbi:peroxiredoxin-like family protein [Parapedobacter sp. DT-150]|uniref:peroxiredoxin-like family protein n=1 Tax=Parapedobacter sp. DT-150 TaxID=3396162 RepID=UPI003F1AF65F
MKHIVLSCVGLYLLAMTSIAQGQQQDAIPQRPEDISPLLNGEAIPMLTIKDPSGMDFDLNKAVSEKPTVLVFYRGGWCPFCNLQLSSLQDILPELEKTGYQLIAISTDAPEGLMEATAKGELGYQLLSDADLNASKRFGIAYKAPQNYWDMLPKTTGGMDVDLLLPVPSVFILDKKGVIRFEYINPDFKQRLDAGLLLVVAQQIYKGL